MQDLENDGPNRRAGKCRTWKMTDQIAGLENAGPGKCLGSKMHCPGPAFSFAPEIQLSSDSDAM